MAQGLSGGWPLFFVGSRKYLVLLDEDNSSLRCFFLPLLGLGLYRAIRVERVWLIYVLGSLLFALIYRFVLHASFSHWYLANIFVSNALLLGAGLRQALELGHSLGSLPGRSPALGSTATWLARGLLCLLVASYLTAAWQDSLSSRSHPARRKIYTRLGEWFRDNTPEDASVAYFEIGYLGYFSQRTIIDPAGLVTPGGAEALRIGKRWWFFEQYEPDYYVHSSHFGNRSITAKPAFKSRYERVETLEESGYPSRLSIYRRR